MASENRDIKLSYKADISNLQRQLAEIPGITEKEAKAMAKALDRQLRKAEASAKRTATSSRKEFVKLKNEVDHTADSMKGLEDATGDTDSALMGVAGALDFVNPALAESVRMVAEFSAGVEGVSRIGPIFKALTGPIGIGIAAVGLFALEWKKVSEELEEAEERMKAASDAAEEMQRVVSRFKALEFTAELERAVALGEESVDVLTARNAQLKAEAVASGALAAATKTLRRSQEGLNLIATESNDLRARKSMLTVKELRELDRLSGEERRLGKQLRRNQAVVEGINRRTANLAATYLETADANTKRGKAAKKTTKSTEKAAEAADLYAEALAREDAAMASVAAQETARIAAQVKLNTLIGSATEDELSGVDRILEKQADRLQQVRSLAMAHEDLIGIEAAAVAARDRAERDLIALRDESHIKLIEQQAEQTEEVAAQLAEQRAIYQEHTVGFFANSAEAFATFADLTADTQKAASIRLFRLAQAAAIAEIVMNTITAASKVTAQTGLGAVLAVPIVVALGAAQAAQVAAESPPSFHAGMAPDERNARLLQGEGVLSRQGVASAGGAQSVRDLNSGQGSSGQIVVQNVYRHRVFDSFVQDNLNRAGPLRSALKRGSGRVGHK